MFYILFIIIYFSCILLNFIYFYPINVYFHFLIFFLSFNFVPILILKLNILFLYLINIFFVLLSSLILVLFESRVLMIFMCVLKP